ncbi:class I SAM-dependent methyltransferase [Paractinoplanes durhamensis]|uniref:class I SAM-dependent methyltransferase n=1 Tax=Paractinoplanes durhamensis TaxID=113563 RepID=UPI0019403F72|nr:class I SAM-dependent methyltransferase [Actinoplanes durhamensis]
MTERRASRTAVLVCQSRAVAHGRIAPDRFADPTAMLLLREAEQEQVLRVRDEQPPKDLAARLQFEMIRAGSEVVVPRTVAIDDAVRTAPTSQLVILGAGLDGRAWRLDLPGTTVYEVDHPASQQEKRDRAAALDGEPPRFVPVDFARDRLTDALKAAGQRDDEPTTWIWEGVVPYLTRPEVATTVAAITARSAPGSRLIVNYQAPSLLAGVTRKVIGAAARKVNPWAAEPWRSTWRPTAMAHLLASNGFAVRRDHDLLVTATALGVRPRQSVSLRNGRVALADH